MKIRYAFFIILLICLTSLSSCTKNNAKDDTLKLAEKYNQEDLINYDYLYKLTYWLTPEKEYNYSSDDSMNNIDIKSDYLIKNNKLYFSVSNNSGNNLYAYIDLKTGDKFFLCPDPFCPHTRESGCKYLDLFNLIFSPSSDNIIYAVKIVLSEDFYNVICFIDTENDTYREIYKVNSNENIRNYIRLYFIHDNKLYFSITQDERIIENGEFTSVSIKYYYMALDLHTNEVETLNIEFLSQEYEHIVYVNDKYIFFDDYENGRFFATDLNFENERTILDYGKDFSRTSLCYDKETQELFIVICSKSFFSSSAEKNDIETGYVYCINNNLEYHKLEMPSDKIIDIKLTRKYIYYTIYDPIYYGTSPRNIPCIDESGNKIYRVSRDNTTSSELIFDGHEILFFKNGYIVTGDYIYMDYYALVNEGSMYWFRYMRTAARINFVDNTIKWFNID